MPFAMNLSIYLSIHLSHISPLQDNYSEALPGCSNSAYG